MHKTIHLDFGIIEIHEHYLIGTVNEGVLLTDEVSYEITQHALEHFNKKPFVYITNRINSYAVDPGVYKFTNRITNLAGFAVVSPNAMRRENAAYEQTFLTKNFGIFETLEEAIVWATDRVDAVKEEEE